MFQNQKINQSPSFGQVRSSSQDLSNAYQFESAKQHILRQQMIDAFQTYKKMQKAQQSPVKRTSMDTFQAAKQPRQAQSQGRRIKTVLEHRDRSHKPHKRIQIWEDRKENRWVSSASLGLFPEAAYTQVKVVQPSPNERVSPSSTFFTDLKIAKYQRKQLKEAKSNQNLLVGGLEQNYTTLPTIKSNNQFANTYSKVIEQQAENDEQTSPKKSDSKSQSIDDETDAQVNTKYSGTKPSRTLFKSPNNEITGKSDHVEGQSNHQAPPILQPVKEPSRYSSHNRWQESSQAGASNVIIKNGTLISKNAFFNKEQARNKDLSPINSSKQRQWRFLANKSLNQMNLNFVKSLDMSEPIIKKKNPRKTRGKQSMQRKEQPRGTMMFPIRRIQRPKSHLAIKNVTVRPILDCMSIVQEKQGRDQRSPNQIPVINIVRKLPRNLSSTQNSCPKVRSISPLDFIESSDAILSHKYGLAFSNKPKSRKNQILLTQHVIPIPKSKSRSRVRAVKQANMVQSSLPDLHMRLSELSQVTNNTIKALQSAIASKKKKRIPRGPPKNAIPSQPTSTNVSVLIPKPQPSTQIDEKSASPRTNLLLSQKNEDIDQPSIGNQKWINIDTKNTSIPRDQDAVSSIAGGTQTDFRNIPKFEDIMLHDSNEKKKPQISSREDSKELNERETINHNNISVHKDNKNGTYSYPERFHSIGTQAQADSLRQKVEEPEPVVASSRPSDKVNEGETNEDSKIEKIVVSQRESNHDVKVSQKDNQDEVAPSEQLFKTTVMEMFDSGHFKSHISQNNNEDDSGTDVVTVNQAQTQHIEEQTSKTGIVFTTVLQLVMVKAYEALGAAREIEPETEERPDLLELFDQCKKSVSLIGHQAVIQVRQSIKEAFFAQVGLRKLIHSTRAYASGAIAVPLLLRTTARVKDLATHTACQINRANTYFATYCTVKSLANQVLEELAQMEKARFERPLLEDEAKRAALFESVFFETFEKTRHSAVDCVANIKVYQRQNKQVEVIGSCVTQVRQHALEALIEIKRQFHSKLFTVCVMNVRDLAGEALNELSRLKLVQIFDDCVAVTKVKAQDALKSLERQRIIRNLYSDVSSKADGVVELIKEQRKVAAKVRVFQELVNSVFDSANECLTLLAWLKKVSTFKDMQTRVTKLAEEAVDLVKADQKRTTNLEVIRRLFSQVYSIAKDALDECLYEESARASIQRNILSDHGEPSTARLTAMIGGYTDDRIRSGSQHAVSDLESELPDWVGSYAHLKDLVNKIANDCIEEIKLLKNQDLLIINNEKEAVTSKACEALQMIQQLRRHDSEEYITAKRNTVDGQQDVVSMVNFKVSPRSPPLSDVGLMAEKHKVTGKANEALMILQQMKADQKQPHLFKGTQNSIQQKSNDCLTLIQQFKEENARKNFLMVFNTLVQFTQCQAKDALIELQDIKGSQRSSRETKNEMKQVQSDEQQTVVGSQTSETLIDIQSKSRSQELEDQKTPSEVDIVSNKGLLFRFNAQVEGSFTERQVDVRLATFINIDESDVSDNNVILSLFDNDPAQLKIPVKQTRNKVSVDKLRQNLRRKLPQIIVVDTEGALKIVKQKRDIESQDSKRSGLTSQTYQSHLNLKQQVSGESKAVSKPPSTGKLTHKQVKIQGRISLASQPIDETIEFQSENISEEINDKASSLNDARSFTQQAKPLSNKAIQQRPLSSKTILGRPPLGRDQHQLRQLQVQEDQKVQTNRTKRTYQSQRVKFNTEIYAIRSQPCSDSSLNIKVEEEDKSNDQESMLDNKQVIQVDMLQSTQKSSEHEVKPDQDQVAAPSQTGLEINLPAGPSTRLLSESGNLKYSESGDNSTKHGPAPAPKEAQCQRFSKIAPAPTENLPEQTTVVQNSNKISAAPKSSAADDKGMFVNPLRKPRVVKKSQFRVEPGDKLSDTCIVSNQLTYQPQQASKSDYNQPHKDAQEDQKSLQTALVSNTVASVKVLPNILKNLTPDDDIPLPKQLVNLTPNITHNSDGKSMKSHTTANRQSVKMQSPLKVVNLNDALIDIPEHHTIEPQADDHLDAGFKQDSVSQRVSVNPSQIESNAGAHNQKSLSERNQNKSSSDQLAQKDQRQQLPRIGKLKTPTSQGKNQDGDRDSRPVFRTSQIDAEDALRNIKKQPSVDQVDDNSNPATELKKNQSNPPQTSKLTSRTVGANTDMKRGSFLVNEKHTEGDSSRSFIENNKPYSARRQTESFKEESQGGGRSTTDQNVKNDEIHIHEQVSHDDGEFDHIKDLAMEDSNSSGQQVSMSDNLSDTRIQKTRNLKIVKLRRRQSDSEDICDLAQKLNTDQIKSHHSSGNESIGNSSDGKIADVQMSQETDLKNLYKPRLSQHDLNKLSTRRSQKLEEIIEEKDLDENFKTKIFPELESTALFNERKHQTLSNFFNHKNANSSQNSIRQPFGTSLRPSSSGNSAAKYSEDGTQSNVHNIAMRNSFWVNIKRSSDESQQTTDKALNDQRGIESYEKSNLLSLGDQVLVPDYRTEVFVSFEVIDDNESAIKLIRGDQVIDRKMTPFSLKKIAENYDAASLEQFCAEWLMPCVSVVENAQSKELKLVIHGEMLSEVIYQHFSQQFSRADQEESQQKSSQP